MSEKKSKTEEELLDKAAERFAELIIWQIEDRKKPQKEGGDRGGPNIRRGVDGIDGSRAKAKRKPTPKP